MQGYGPTQAQYSPPAQDPTYARNSQWAVQPPSGGYLTQLAPIEEQNFQQWIKDNNVPFDPSQTADYDMRGFYKSLMSKDGHAETGMNANDGMMHFTDYFKTPYHKSFSAESKFATPNAPSWNDKDQLVTPGGQVVFDERNQ